MRRLTQDDRRRAVEEAVADAIAAGAPLPTATRAAEHVAALLLARNVDPGANALLARAVRRDPTYVRAVAELRARAASGRARLVDAETPLWQVASWTVRELASLGAASAAGASGDDVALAGGSVGGAAMDDGGEVPCVADAADADAAAGGTRAYDAAALGSAATGEGGAATDGDAQAWSGADDAPAPGGGASGEGGATTDGDAQASSGAGASTDDVALAGGTEGGAAMVDEDTSCVAKAADAATAAGGARAGGPGDWSSDDDDDVPLNRVSVHGPRVANRPPPNDGSDDAGARVDHDGDGGDDDDTQGDDTQGNGSIPAPPEPAALAVALGVTAAPEEGAVRRARHPEGYYAEQTDGERRPRERHETRVFDGVVMRVAGAAWRVTRASALVDAELTARSGEIAAVRERGVTRAAARAARLHTQPAASASTPLRAWSFENVPLAAPLFGNRGDEAAVVCDADAFGVPQGPRRGATNTANAGRRRLLGGPVAAIATLKARHAPLVAAARKTPPGWAPALSAVRCVLPPGALLQTATDNPRAGRQYVPGEATRAPDEPAHAVVSRGTKVYDADRGVVAGSLGAVAHGALQCLARTTVPLMRAWFARPADATPARSPSAAAESAMVMTGDALPPPMAGALLSAVLGATPDPKPTCFVDLYCGGAGGVSQAAADLGLRVVLGVDADPDHLGCFLAQHPQAHGALYEFGVETAEASAAYVEQRLAEQGLTLGDVLVHVSPSCKGLSQANTLYRNTPLVEKLHGSLFALRTLRCLRHAL